MALVAALVTASSFGVGDDASANTCAGSSHYLQCLAEIRHSTLARANWRQPLEGVSIGLLQMADAYGKQRLYVFARNVGASKQSIGLPVASLIRLSDNGSETTFPTSTYACTSSCGAVVVAPGDARDVTAPLLSDFGMVSGHVYQVQIEFTTPSLAKVRSPQALQQTLRSGTVSVTP